MERSPGVRKRKGSPRFKATRARGADHSHPAEGLLEAGRITTMNYIVAAIDRQ